MEPILQILPSQNLCQFLPSILVLVCFAFVAPSLTVPSARVILSYGGNLIAVAKDETPVQPRTFVFFVCFAAATEPQSPCVCVCMCVR